MTTTLTDSERILLSAFSDGELAGPEMARAEQLLASSSAARDYVRDLHSLTEMSQAAFPAAPAIGVGSKLTSNAIQTAARTATKTASRMSLGVAGLAAAAVTTVAVLTSTLGSDDATKASERTPATTSNASIEARPASLGVNSAALMVPAITNKELIDFAVSGRLPIDSTRQCFVSVAPQRGALAINVHSTAGKVPDRLSGLDLRAVPGIDSIERAIRTSLLQSDGNGLAVSFELPSLRLRVLEELQEAANELPLEIRRSIDGTRAELQRECQNLASELRQSRLSARRSEGAPIRYMVIAGSDLPKRAAPGTVSATFTMTTNDSRLQTLELSGTEVGTLEALVEGPRFVAVERSASPRIRSTSPLPDRVLIRRSPVAVRASSSSDAAGGDAAEDSTISFEEIQILKDRGQTLDGLFLNSEEFISRATLILQRADSIRKHIQMIRLQGIEAGQDLPDESNDELDAIDSNNQGGTVAPN